MGRVIYLLFGVLIGLGHLQLALRATFVFREHEPWLSWAIMICGPFLTLPAVLISFKSIRVASWLLICGGGMSLVFMIASDGVRGENVVPSLAILSGPMFFLGALGLLFLHHAIGLEPKKD
jgi:hypothetical protein